MEINEANPTIDNNEDISPASIIPKALITWSDSQKGSNIRVEDKSAIYEEGGIFRWIRTNEEFSTGRNSFYILFDGLEGKSCEHVSVGVCWDQNMTFDNNTFYFSNSQVYCNFYPTITFGFSLLYTPPKCNVGDTIGITIDHDSKEVIFSINYEDIYTTPLKCDDFQPCFIVGALFKRMEIVCIPLSRKCFIQFSARGKVVRH